MKRRTSLILCLIALSFLVFPANNMATPVPDTGQTKCYNDSVEITCPEPGQAFYGQDAQYTCNPHSYTDLGNGVVRDNVTGLEWQQATAPGTYSWQRAINYCNNLSLSGKDDWRLPTIKELSTIVDSSIPEPGPAINTTFFPGTVASYYWSSTAFTDNPGYAWLVGFNAGLVVDFSESLAYYVRAVRGAQSSNNFIDNSDGTVTDISTGLMWQQLTAPWYTWEQALTYCESLTLGGYSDWRLPNRNELHSIVDYSKNYPAIDTRFFPSTGVQYYYWSSTSIAYSSDYAWEVGFAFGGVNKFVFKTSDIYIRAVRGGQCGATVIDLSSFTAAPGVSKVILEWNTESEIDNAGFNIYRAESESGAYIKINESLIPSQGSSTEGAVYEFTDSNVQNRKTYFYKLEDIDLNGTGTLHGPVSATPRLMYGIGK